jgi:acetylornithine/succinyldiaminopimelate/putrescine aminotransferase
MEAVTRLARDLQKTALTRTVGSLRSTTKSRIRRGRLNSLRTSLQVLVEGMQGRGPCIVGTHGVLHQAKKSARKLGAVFILDEVQRSRLAPGGLQQLLKLELYITTLGKVFGGGIAFGAFEDERTSCVSTTHGKRTRSVTRALSTTTRFI